MELKGTILEKSGSEVTGVEDAIFNRFLTNFRDGIIQGAYEEARFSLLSSNTLHIAKGEALICGMRVIIEETAESFSVFPRTSTRYQIVLQIQKDELGQPKFNSIIREIEELKQEDILNAELPNAVYQVELGRFSLNGDRIEDPTRTLDTIVSGANTSSQELNIGNVTTQKIDISLPAEVDVNNRFDTNQQKYFVDFNFALPVNIQKDTIDKIDLSLANSENAMNAVQDFHKMEAVVAQLQTEVIRLQEDRNQVIKDALLKAYPIGIIIYNEDTNFDPNTAIGGQWEETESLIKDIRTDTYIRSLQDIIGNYGDNTTKSFIAEYDGMLTLKGHTVLPSNNTIYITRISNGKLFTNITDGVSGVNWGTSAIMMFKKGNTIEISFRNVNPAYEFCTVEYNQLVITKGAKGWKRIQ